MTAFPQNINQSKTPEELELLRRQQFEQSRQKAATMMSPEFKGAVKGATEFARSLLPQEEPVQQTMPFEEQDLGRLQRLTQMVESADQRMEPAAAPVEQEQAPAPIETPQVGTNAINTDEYGRSTFTVTDPSGSGRTANLPAVQDPSKSGAFFPKYDSMLNPQAVGEAAAASNEYRTSISNLSRMATESGIKGDLFTELEDADRALDIDRSAFPRTVAGNKQFAQAQQQARRKYGTAAKRLLKRQDEIFGARDRTAKTFDAATDSQVKDIQAIAERLIKESSADEFRSPMTQEQAYSSAFQEYNRTQSIQRRLRDQISSDQFDPDSFAVEQEQVRQPFVSIRPEQFGRVAEFTSRVSEDLPYDLQMAPGGSAQIVTDFGAFEAVAHAGSPVPVALVRSQNEKQLAESAGIPHITPGNPNKIHNQFKASKTKGRGDTTRSKGDFGVDSFDPEKSVQESIVTASEEFDEVYDNVVGLVRSQETLPFRRDSYSKLVRKFMESQRGRVVSPQMAEKMSNLEDPNFDPVISAEDQEAFKAFVEMEMTTGNQEVAALVEAAGVDVGNPLLPQENDLSALDPQVQQALDLYEQMTVSTGFAQDKAPSREAFRMQYIESRSGQLQNENFARAQEQTYFRDRLTGSDVRRDIADRTATAYSTGYDQATGQRVATASEGNFNPDFELKGLPLVDGAVAVSEAGDIAHVAFDSPFIARGQREPVQLDIDELDDLLREATKGKVAVGRFRNIEMFDDQYIQAATAVSDYLVNKVPGFFSSERDLGAATMQMLRRLGFKN